MRCELTKTASVPRSSLHSMRRGFGRLLPHFLQASNIKKGDRSSMYDQAIMNPGLDNDKPPLYWYGLYRSIGENCSLYLHVVHFSAFIHCLIEFKLIKRREIKVKT